MRILEKHYCTIKGFRGLFLLFFLVIVFTLQAHTAYAKVKIDKPVQTVYLRNCDTGDIQPEMLFYIELSGSDRIKSSSIHSDNEWVTGKVNCYRPKNINSLYLGIHPKNPGTANISFKSRSGRKYKVTANVLPYENPIKSLTITNVKEGENLALLTDKSRHFWDERLEFSKSTEAPRAEVVTKENWRLLTVAVYTLDSRGALAEAEAANVNAQAKTLELEKALKGNTVEVYIYLQNMENGAYQFISLGKYWFHPV